MLQQTIDGPQGVRALTLVTEAEPAPCLSKPETMDISSRMRDQGPQNLSTPELLSVVLALGRPGKEEACLGKAQKILRAPGGLLELRRSRVTDLTFQPGIGESRGNAICAAIELGNRIASAERPAAESIHSPRDADAILRPRIAHLDREVFCVILLDTKNKVIAVLTIAIGTLSTATVHPREIFKPAIKASAAGVILAHNHPSGATNPSQEDKNFTRRLQDAGETIGIEVIDHLIVGDPGFSSLKEMGLL